MSLRPTGIVLTIAGALMASVLLARLLLPPLLDFVLLPVAHLLLAFGALGLSAASVRSRPVGIAAGTIWGAGWLLLFLSEALMLLWILPPAWLRVDAPIIVLGGLAAGALALALHRGSPLARAKVPRWAVPAYAVVSSLFLWLGIGLSAVFPGMPSELVYAMRSAEEVLLAAATLAMGIALLLRSRRAAPLSRASAA